MSTEILTRIEDLILPILSGYGLELADLELKGEGRRQILRIFIDRPGGVTLDDCAEVSREVDALFEVEDPIPGAYTLEVSSPGLDRPLKKAGDFARHVGRPVKIKTTALLDPDGRGHLRKTFVGELLGIDADRVRLRQTDKRGGEVTIALGEIAKANLEIDF
ncbi:MAG: ribosome maturation factor RimP [Deltaproteobacteria bacterium]|nr:MAG: ribosome maturation factor RimP [Deltaproteobacteria bacterium]